MWASAPQWVSTGCPDRRDGASSRKAFKRLAFRDAPTDCGLNPEEPKLNKRMAPQVGLEPTTLRLTAECSAIELLRNFVCAIQLSSSYNTRRKRNQRAANGERTRAEHRAP